MSLSIMQIPSQYVCPITMELMVHPMASRHGQNFERAAIVDWLRKGNGMCPITRQPLSYSDLIHNNCLSKEIQLWCDVHGLPDPIELESSSSSSSTNSDSWDNTMVDDDVVDRLTHVYGTIDSPFAKPSPKIVCVTAGSSTAPTQLPFSSPTQTESPRRKRRISALWNQLHLRKQLQSS